MPIDVTKAKGVFDKVRAYVDEIEPMLEKGIEVAKEVTPDLPMIGVPLTAALSTTLVVTKGAKMAVDTIDDFVDKL